ncbi:MAG: SsrA-binding protein SmpB [Cytophagales bacterium]|nr:SsrA-binding protein SmpB [Bernardetiaceae bacterium]MDW8205584.1 SsrA-binding protein SmpB [Cytophagales bacterium]
MPKQKNKYIKNLSVRNKRAAYEYFFIDKYTAGIVLRGTEIKSMRLGKFNMDDAYCLFNEKGELIIRNLYIAEYEMGNIHNHPPRADRKLLLTKRELRKLQSSLKDVGLTIVPTHIFINERGLLKVEIALAKGKKLYDKREAIKERDLKRAMD